jgi:hypothetical protein
MGKERVTKWAMQEFLIDEEAYQGTLPVQS